MKPHSLAILLSVLSAGMNAINYEPQASQPAPAKTQSGTAANQTAINQEDTSTTGAYRPGSGTIILAQLAKPLDVRKLSVGAQVECSVIQDLLYKGKIIIPREAKVIGHVTEATASSKEQPQSRLGLVFDRIVLKDKRELPFQYPAVITALAPPINWSLVSTTKMQDMPVQMEKGTDTGGAAVGALVANPNLAGANMRSSGSGAITAGNHGVTGMKGLTLDATNPETSVIVSSKGDVKLGFEVQMVLRVTDPPKK
jgi:hypothetical protein